MIIVEDLGVDVPVGAATTGQGMEFLAPLSVTHGLLAALATRGASISHCGASRTSAPLFQLHASATASHCAEGVSAVVQTVSAEMKDVVIGTSAPAATRRGLLRSGVWRGAHARNKRDGAERRVRRVAERSRLVEAIRRRGRVGRRVRRGFRVERRYDAWVRWRVGAPARGAHVAGRVWLRIGARAWREGA